MYTVTWPNNGKHYSIFFEKKKMGCEKVASFKDKTELLSQNYLISQRHRAKWLHHPSNVILIQAWIFSCLEHSDQLYFVMEILAYTRSLSPCTLKNRYVIDICEKDLMYHFWQTLNISFDLTYQIPENPVRKLFIWPIFQSS